MDAHDMTNNVVTGTDAIHQMLQTLAWKANTAKLAQDVGIPA
jgi:hypothetical protein